MPDSRRLNIVDEHGTILGEETREMIHKQGLLHREIHIWFYTPKKEIIFQHRAKDKDTYPDLLDSAVGGHVEIGSNFEETALQELFEETGIKAQQKDLTFLFKIRSRDVDTLTNTINNVINAVYLYRYDGKLEDLKVEEGKAIGFESWNIETLSTLSEIDKKRFIPNIFAKDGQTILAHIKKLL